MLDHPFDNLGVPFSECSHETGDLAVVLRVDVGSRGVKELHNLKMTSIGSEPQTRITLLVPHINLSRENKFNFARKT